MVHFIKRYVYVIIIGILMIAAFFLMNRKDDIDQEMDLALTLKEEPAAANEAVHEETLEKQTEIIVDIKGAVKKPGVYTLDEGARMLDIIELSGGFTEKADERQINLAERIYDEMFIYIPKTGEDTAEILLQSQATAPVSEAGDKVQINQATMEELETLNGIGPSKAQAILNYMEENGPFQTEEELLQVSGIGEKTLENFKDNIIIP